MYTYNWKKILDSTCIYKQSENQIAKFYNGSKQAEMTRSFSYYAWNAKHEEL